MPVERSRSDKPLLDLRDVTVRIGDVTLVDAMSLSIFAGAPTVLMGPNGAGKTTLLKVMMGLRPSTSGTIIRAIQRASFVFQKPVMLRRSVAENVAFALAHSGQPVERGAVDRALEQVGLSALADRPARRLSGGEQQRLALARALVRNPEILFLDEPTASLDPAQTKAVEDSLAAAAARGVKIVMSTHDIGEARRLAGEVIFLAKGRVLEQSKAVDFFRQPSSAAARGFLAGEIVI